MDKVKAKKHLGQHFLNDETIANKIADALSGKGYTHVLEVGPGMGVLTQFLLPRKEFATHVVEIDTESIVYLQQHFPELNNRIINGDFLHLSLEKLFNNQPFGLIGNYPYNISSQIVFKMLENKTLIPEMVGMFQKEVAERICASPGSKEYGILSVLTQAYYHTTYLFTVLENQFTPPPKVKSGVIKLVLKENEPLNCDEVLFKKLVKQAFNQRRKMLRNSLKTVGYTPEQLNLPIFTKRPEQLSLQEFIMLTNWVA